MEDFVKALTLHLASATEAAAALVIGLAIIEAVLRSLLMFARHGGTDPRARPVDHKEDVRFRLGRWLALALEFELAADILRTAVAPTWNESGSLRRSSSCGLR
jgi:uncharacterized membrane protein